MEKIPISVYLFYIRVPGEGRRAAAHQPLIDPFCSTCSPPKSCLFLPYHTAKPCTKLSHSKGEAADAHTGLGQTSHQIIHRKKSTSLASDHPTAPQMGVRKGLGGDGNDCPFP